MATRLAFPTLSGIVLGLLVLCRPISDANAQEVSALESIRAWLKSAETPAEVASFSDLRTRAFLVRDALAYNVAREYVKERDAGKSHLEAIAELRELTSRWRHFRNVVELRVVITGSEKPGSGTIYTIDARSFPARVIGLRAGRKRIAGKLAGITNLSVKNIRINKYLGRKPGLPEFPHIQDPFKPAVSKPFKVLFFDKQTVDVGLLIRKSQIEKVEELEITLANIKTYTGPFKDNRIDVNLGRTWALLPGMKGTFRFKGEDPPLPQALEKVLEPVRSRL